ncbi:FG-GAP-like repeat-containing protein, partial [Flavivirga aquimarina]
MKVNKTILITILFLSVMSSQSYAQTTTKSGTKNGLGPNDFPELINANIPGAPKLGKPQLIMGDSIPIRGEGKGWAAPAVYDWDGDEKKDLLIGEFRSGYKYGLNTGHFVRVYQNKGTEDAPEFNDDFFYANGINDLRESTGTPLSIYTWCCFPFTPRFTDLDADGFTDLLTGQYNPGYITWFRGSQDGFLPGITLEEDYDALIASKQNNQSLPITDPKGMKYWNYSSVDFGDFDNDGDQDMIVGGGALRICENIGTKSTPKFGKRELLLDTQGQALEGGSLAVPYVVDWDGDGVLDILMTDSFRARRSAAVIFFRGLKSKKEELCFEAGIPLFSTKNDKKEFPGSWLNVCVTDWNNDGVN